MAGPLLSAYVAPTFRNENRDVIVIVAIEKNIARRSQASLLAPLMSFIRSEGRWLAKNLVVLIAIEQPKGSITPLESVENWLQSYHGARTSNIQRPLFPVSGTISAALVLKNLTETPSTVNLGVAGRNGRLPNMDLINLVSQSFDNRASIEGDKWSLHPSFAKRLHSMICFLRSLLSGPSGLHESFLAQGIDAISIEFIEDLNQGSSIERTLGCLENVIRGLNNLEEKLQHGFYIYLMIGSNFFVSIGEVSITIALSVVPFALSIPRGRIKSIVPGCYLFASSALLSALSTWLWGQSSLSPSIFANFSAEFGRILVSAYMVVILIRSKLIRPCKEGSKFLISVLIVVCGSILAFQNPSTSSFGVHPILGALVCSSVAEDQSIALFVSALMAWAISCEELSSVHCYFYLISVFQSLVLAEAWVKPYPQKKAKCEQL
eukprot:CAMPEP_0172606876 /NCGR_PEP_ID=MMETSP1068-20121228/27084_1 /TAXON_ID=35684 /ORGANISM="Pseudopedinella elastica, Strain CCMP716" /LENGTH=434 /DNA_ID=CAMNT_0013409737 /DNA_START=448 /DNA_END=1752 /DNA_ORIENTATION=+